MEQNLERSQESQMTWHDRNAEERWFDTGDLVLVLIPMRKNKMQDCWEGPCEVLARVNQVTYSAL